MNIEELTVGQHVWEKASNRRLEITGKGKHFVFGLMEQVTRNGVQTFEVSFNPEELSSVPFWPPLVVNIYVPDLLEQGRAPARVFSTMEKALEDPDYQFVMGQLWVSETGRVDLTVL
jgi:hypothetical protein